MHAQQGEKCATIARREAISSEYAKKNRVRMPVKYSGQTKKERLQLTKLTVIGRAQLSLKTASQHGLSRYIWLALLSISR
jgi:hypothetical protein